MPQSNPGDAAGAHAASRSARTALTGGRQTCYACFRPVGQCYCGRLPRVDNRTEIIILQHPRERFHPIGTARIASLGLQRVRVEVDIAGRFSEGRERLVLPEGTGLLYPEAPFRDLATLAPSERPRHLLVLDGTWHHAHTLFRDVPGLSALPRYGFTPAAPSEYRLRREPRAECVSTVEAIAQCLRVLEPETAGVEQLVDAFRSMIDQQVAARPDLRVGRSLKHRRPERFRKLPRALVEDFERLVVVYGEWHCPDGSSQRRELIQWSACRLRTGETFDALISPSRALGAHLYRCLEIAPASFDGSVPVEQFWRDWASFITPEDLFAAWCPDTARRRIWSNSANLDSCVSLKAAYHALERSAGPLEDIIASEGLSPRPAPCLGRAARRIGNAEALARFIHEMASEDAEP
jgi:DTW domain-containing protein